MGANVMTQTNDIDQRLAKAIKLNKGHVAIVDDDWYEMLSPFKWYIHDGGYVVRPEYHKGTYSINYMHRLIADAPKGLTVDHINGDPLDNRRENLRICSQQKNHCNKKPKEGCSSKYKGVNWNKANGMWMARIGHNYKTHYLGYYSDEVEAAKAYDAAAIKLHGEFAYLNFRAGMQP